MTTVGDWRITLDRRREADERFFRTLRDGGQSGVTHLGQVERADGHRSMVTTYGRS